VSPPTILIPIALLANIAATLLALVAIFMRAVSLSFYDGRATARIGFTLFIVGLAMLLIVAPATNISRTLHLIAMCSAAINCTAILVYLRRE